MNDILYQDLLLFQYDKDTETLICPYCHEDYNFNNNRVRTKFLKLLNPKSDQIKLNEILFRCIKCATCDPTYLFKLACDFSPNLEQSTIIAELYQQILITNQSQYTDHLLLVEGQAGTGKTSTIMSLFKYPEFNQFKICFASPTNKALNVMMEKLNKQEETDVRPDDETVEDEDPQWTFKTTFKLSNGKTSINSFGETLFESGIIDDLPLNYDIIVIDEVSMIERKQLESIVATVQNMKRQLVNDNAPIIIFLGDHGQLPPVSESGSIIFDVNTQHQYSIKKLTLTQIMRSQDRLSDLSRHVRQLIPFSLPQLIDHDLPVVNLKQFNCPQITTWVNRDHWLDQYVTMFKAVEEGDVHSQKSQSVPIILVYTNAECDNTNTECRDRLFNNPSEPYVPGELLIFKSYYCLKRQKFVNATNTKTTYYVKLFTSEPFIVKMIQNVEMMIRPFSYGTILGTGAGNTLIEKIKVNLIPWINRKVSAQKVDYITEELTYLLLNWEIDQTTGKVKAHDPVLESQLNKLTNLINKLNHQYIVTYLYMDGYSKLDSYDTNPDDVYITVIAHQCVDQYLANCDKIKSLIKTSYQSLMSNFKNNTTTRLLIDYIFQQIWKTYYYRTYIWPFASVTYGYAMTTHKSQGSTYQNTFINIPNIIGCRKVDDIVRAKSLYTAMTRAAKSTNVLTQSQMLYPMISANTVFKCHVCHQSGAFSSFPPVNCTIDKKCAERLLMNIKPMFLYCKDTEGHVIISDKYKNLYKVDGSKLSDRHINDAYDYIVTNKLLKTEIERYQQSNLALLKQVQVGSTR